MDKKNTPTPLRITVVEPRGTGGMIHYAHQLCEAMSKAGAQVTLVTSTVYEMDDFLHTYTLHKQMRLWSTTEAQEVKSGTSQGQIIAQSIFKKIRRGVRGIRLIVEWIRLVIYLLGEKPDIIQFGATEFPFEALFLRILKRKGLVLSQVCHEFELREQGNGILIDLSNRLFRWVYGSFSIIFFHGESNRQKFIRFFDGPKERLYVIEHGNEGLFLTKQTTKSPGIQVRQRYGIQPDAPVILFFGNLMPSKGVPDLLKGFAQVLLRENRARLVIAGNPSKYIDMDELRKLAAELNIGKATIFDARYIPMEDVAGLMDMSLVAIYPYLTSTQSGALQVAYSFSKPVIATNVGGLPDVVEDGKSGFLISPASPNELANAILKFIEKPSLAKEMGRYAKHLSETRFSWDAIARKIIYIYSDELKRKS